MRQLKKRLERLESRLMDNSGCMPYTKEWFLYWGQQVEQLLAGEDVAKPPIAFFDALFRVSDRREAARTGVGESESDGCAEPTECSNQ
jgi:hypothetical protein